MDTGSNSYTAHRLLTKSQILEGFSVNKGFCPRGRQWTWGTNVAADQGVSHPLFYYSFSTFLRKDLHFPTGSRWTRSPRPGPQPTPCALPHPASASRRPAQPGATAPPGLWARVLPRALTCKLICKTHKTEPSNVTQRRTARPAPSPR